jgi:hypothetical protein
MREVLAFVRVLGSSPADATTEELGVRFLRSSRGIRGDTVTVKTGLLVGQLVRRSMPGTVVAG